MVCLFDLSWTQATLAELFSTCLYTLKSSDLQNIIFGRLYSNESRSTLAFGSNSSKKPDFVVGSGHAIGWTFLAGANHEHPR